MTKPATHDDIQEAESRVEVAKVAYLKRFGWSNTCNMPGSYWLWRRDFLPEDTARHEAWRERGPGPMGWSSEPRPYGVITASTGLAVSMTRSSLDEDIGEDGESE